MGNLQPPFCDWASTKPYLGIHVVLLCCCDECWITDVQLQVGCSCFRCCVALTVVAHMPTECCERECIGWGKTPMHTNDVRHTGILGHDACISTSKCNPAAQAGTATPAQSGWSTVLLDPSTDCDIHLPAVRLAVSCSDPDVRGKAHEQTQQSCQAVAQQCPPCKDGSCLR